MKKKSTTKSKSALIEKLDKVFSHFIRLRDSDDNGYCRCISCGKIEFWKYIQNGHFVNRGHMSTRFDERNCNAQCVKCNMFAAGNDVGYTKGLIIKYGPEIIDELHKQEHQLAKFSDSDLKDKIKHYQKQVSSLKEQKQL